MLRITPNRSLEFRAKKSRLSPELWKGLAIALAFHLLFFTCFRIVKSYSSAEAPLLSPVAVEIDLGTPEICADKEPWLTLSPLGDECPSFPSLPHDPSLSFKEFALLEPDFTPVEMIPYQIEEEEEL